MNMKTIEEIRSAVATKQDEIEGLLAIFREEGTSIAKKQALSIDIALRLGFINGAHFITGEFPDER